MPGEIFSAALTIKAMRDNGYRNPAMALAELIDNSIQAGATEVAIGTYSSRVGNINQLSKVAVLDNGCGMDTERLEASLQFGNGSHQDDPSGIGKFGMGLPNSSCSQCKRVDVYTWTVDGGVLHSYLDIDEIILTGQTTVNPATPADIPSEFHELVGDRSDSGTLVVWSSLDRLLKKWKTVEGLWPNTEFQIGRIYRKFISQGEAQIIHKRFVQKSAGGFEQKGAAFAKPNDPIYLMKGTNCPVDALGPNRAGDLIAEPLFEPFGNESEMVNCRDPETGEVHTIHLRFAVAKASTIDFKSAGNMKHGKHAEKNMGASIIRARRELQLQKGWCLSSEARDRWWGAEVDFPPYFDELFGVSNTKQEATALHEMALTDLDEAAKEEGYDNVLHLLKTAQDVDQQLYVKFKVAHILKKNISAMRTHITSLNAGTRTSSRVRGGGPAEVAGTEATQKRVARGKQTISDTENSLPEDEKIERLKKHYESEGMEPSEAFEKATAVVQSQMRYAFQYGPVATPDFFTPTSVGGVYQVKINVRHPVYTEYMQKIESLSQESSPEKVREALHVSQEVFKLLLESWVRYEDEAGTQDEKDQLSQHRVMWGLLARDFIKGLTS